MVTQYGFLNMSDKSLYILAGCAAAVYYKARMLFRDLGTADCIALKPALLNERACKMPCRAR